MLPIIADGIGSVLSNPSENLITLSFVVGLVLVMLVFSIGAVWHQIHKSDIEASLKQQMIQSGMSVDEIERVLAAKMDGKPKGGITLSYSQKKQS
jgi:hypothetical protein